MALSRSGQLSLSLAEMRAIRATSRPGPRPDRLRAGDARPDLERALLAQDAQGAHRLRRPDDRQPAQGDDLRRDAQLACDWLVSVFSDNAGVIRFDDEHDVCFKVETHNHPSAIDPYGGSNTGLGGVIRDALGTGLGAKPICNTDVFCVAPPDLDPRHVPPGVLHPKRVLKGVVAGVRDYGNRMGIPTVNGALAVHPGYLANPLVFCGTVGVLPRGMSTKHVEPGDRIVAIGGRTGRDGIHGATFSSAELTAHSESVSGGAVQIGNAITEKMVLDVIVQARDRGLFRAITDCGAGGFSSAVGEMGAELGAEVELEPRPAQICRPLLYRDLDLRGPGTDGPRGARRQVAGAAGALPSRGRRGHRTGPVRRHRPARPPLSRRAGRRPVDGFPARGPADGRPRGHMDGPAQPPARPAREKGLQRDLLALLGHWDACSKEWIVRQYDHEVQARTVIKPMVGVRDDGPGDAAVVLPVRGSTRGLAVGCGINPRYGSSTRMPWRAASSTRRSATASPSARIPRESRSSTISAGATPSGPRPWDRSSGPREACRDVSLAYRTPFISGKDSLNNEYTHEGRSLAIPPTLLISAIGIVPDVRAAVTMDLKRPGMCFTCSGTTRNELGGSLWAEVNGQAGGSVPRVNVEARPGPVPCAPRGHAAGTDPELPRPQRGRPGRRRWPRWRWPAGSAPP